MRLCSECVNYVKDEEEERFDKCNYYNMITPVRGTPILKYCDIMRDKYGACGVEATFHTVRFDNCDSTVPHSVVES